MRTQQAVWYALLGLLVALVMFGIMSTANIVHDLAMRAALSLLIGAIFAITLVSHKTLKADYRGSEAEFDAEGEADSEAEGEADSEGQEEEEEDDDDDDDTEADSEAEDAEADGEAEEKSAEQLEDEEDEKADASDVSNTRKNPYAGYSRISAKARRKAERNMRSADRYLGEGEGVQGKHLEKLLTYDGLRRIEDSILYAKESYKDHELNEHDEGLDQRYVDPTLTTYSPEFAAYGDDSYILDPRLLSVYAPMTF
jgi:predicted lipid-binding transport protein (Tim44 family)